MPTELNFLLRCEGADWVALVEEFDVSGEGRDPEEAIDEALEQINRHIEAAVDLDEIDGLIPRPISEPDLTEERLRAHRSIRVRVVSDRPDRPEWRNR